MARPTDPNRYPALYRTAIEKLGTEGKPLKFPCTDMKEAKNFRLTFHCFRTAALKHGWKARYPELEVALCRIKEDDGIYVELSNAEDDPTIQRWNKVVGL